MGSCDHSSGIQSQNCSSSSLTMKSIFFVFLLVGCCSGWISGVDAGFTYVGAVGSKLFIKDDDFNGTLYETKAHCVNAGYDLIRVETEEELGFLMQNHFEHFRRNYWLDAKASRTTEGRGCFVWFYPSWEEIPSFLRPYHYEEVWGIGLQFNPSRLGSDFPQVPMTRQGAALCTITLNQ